MTYDLKLEQAEVMLIMQALGELPLKLTVGVFAKVQAQVAEQDSANAIEVADVKL